MGSACCANRPVFDWKSIDNAKTPTIGADQSAQVKQIFDLLKDADLNEQFVQDVFAKLFAQWPGIMDYFNILIFESDDEGVESPKQILADAAVKSGNFLEHVVKISGMLFGMVDDLTDENNFRRRVEKVNIEHAKIPGLDRVFFKSIIESIDEVLLEDLGPLRYNGSKRKAMQKFLVILYCHIGKHIPQGPLDWVAIENYKRMLSRSKTSKMSKKSVDRDSPTSLVSVRPEPVK